MSSRFILGIDLGTTNSALAAIERPAGDARPAATILPIPQVVAPGSVLERSTLPSFMYLAGEGELPPGALDLPWAPGRAYAVGAGARDRGAEVPLRMVGSAKSWLGHGAVDRRAALLPFGAPPEVPKVSPVTASLRYLEHLRDAWDAAHPDAPMAAQDVFLTVPASFDAVARDLTVEAARAAGIAELTLLEEPQAAFYAWLERLGEAWRKQLKPGDVVLVADVGGGTTDFSLIEVRDQGGNLTLERVAVGDHILLGGDNMDLALAHAVSAKLHADGKKLDAGQSRALVLAVRGAKEKLLGDESATSAPITLLGRGSKLIGNKISTTLERAELEQLLVEGFFPACTLDTPVVAARRTGFMELGLPFASDTAITRHLAAFLTKHGRRLPTHLLYNGGVFNSPVLRRRLLEVMTGFGAAPTVLDDADHDLAVARGAAYFGLSKGGHGIRIKGGVARSYYVGIETAMPAVPGMRPPIRALCVVPFGMEEGSGAPVPSAELGLVVGEPVAFRFLSATARKDDAIGTLLDEYEWPEHLEETAPLELTLEAEGLAPGTLVPVRLEVKVTEIGTVEVWCARTDGAGRWRLELNLRETEGTSAA